MNFSKERETFRWRLLTALRDKGLPTSASALARLINVYAPHHVITAVGVRKWLVGDSLPNPSNMDLLSTMIGVRAGWLRYGDGPQDAVVSFTKLPSSEGIGWAVELSCLTPPDILLVTGLVKNLLEQQQKSDDAYNITLG